ncbi:hypothetical protein [Nonomuraea diastatica]|uniref:hypothetical protein n=1 Tax=Nonomuraea diastatica TaxID=1848329 RepID=UPI001FE7B044|nr:hypothetical protein [Nonomuraea diastatica]
MRITLTRKDSGIAEEFYVETCKRIEDLTAGLAGADRDTLAHLLGCVVQDNKVPAVFREPGEGVHPGYEH